MKASIRDRLEATRDRFEEVSGLLADPDIIGNQNRFRDLSKEYARLEPVITLFRRYEKLAGDVAAAEEMANDRDPDVREMGREELDVLRDELVALFRGRSVGTGETGQK